jgi:hypothetical protein
VTWIKEGRTEATVQEYKVEEWQPQSFLSQLFANENKLDSYTCLMQPLLMCIYSFFRRKCFTLAAAHFSASRGVATCMPAEWWCVLAIFILSLFLSLSLSLSLSFSLSLVAIT